jgi:DNA-binding MarR family transcriptional regulator
MTGPHTPSEVSLPALLRAARGVYAAAIRQALAEADYGDIPGNGLFVIGAIARANAPLSRIIVQLGVSKQAAGQLIDTMVLRGYLERTVDPEDRRRLTIGLSKRGRAAAKVIGSVVERMETDLVKRVDPESVAQARKVLQALIELGRSHREIAAAKQEWTPDYFGDR